MRDLFDEFMDELRRRQAAATGDDARGRSGPGDHGPSDDDPSRDDEDGSGSGEPDRDTGSGHDSPDDGDAHGDASDDDPTPPGPEPTPIDARRARPGAGHGEGSAGRRPPPGGPNDGARSGGRGWSGRRIAAVAIVVALILLFTLGGSLVNLWTDLIWYRSVGFDSVFWTRLLTQAGLFVGMLLLALLFLLGSFWLADRVVPPTTGRSGGGSITDRIVEAIQRAEERSQASNRYQAFGGRDDPRFEGWSRQRRPPGGGTVVLDSDDIPELTPIVRIVLIVVAVIFALAIAGGVSSNWETIQLWAHQVTFAPDGQPPVVDPIFGRDIGFYLFQLPFIRLVQSVATTLLIGALLIAAARYTIGFIESGLVLTTRIRVHLAVLGGLLLILVAIGYQLDKLELVYSNRGVATGVSFTDQHAQFLAFDVLTVIAALAGAFLVGAAFTRWIWPLGVVVVAWLGASFVLGTVYPSLVQQLSVKPNEFAQESPYINNNITMTRLAFDLTNWSSTPFDGSAPLTAAAVQQESATFQNARIWDYRPLGATLDQLQTIRQYYDFTDVDTDRYTINGQVRQVMLAARELAPEKNPQANSWVNQRITFTHGIGLAMVPVNQATTSGQPDLIIKDLPPVSTAGAPTIAQPRIYFGERPSDYVIVNAQQPAFDYPLGSDASTGGSDGAPAPPWTGTSGIKLDTGLSRLLFSIRFRDLNLLISDQITGDSQLLFHRSLSDRLQLIAPFLRFDQDPYLVVTGDGRLVYIQDAYTISDRFPNAQAFDGSDLGPSSGLANDTFDYIRNSVKIVMDAYTGQMTFYVADPDDPIIRAYEGVFPSLFTPLDQMPADLQAHLRVPEELFNVQTAQFATYHVTNPGTFYARNDLWTVPSPSGSSQSLPPEAYYVYMRLPDVPNPEFLLLQPMVPQSRPNMIAWVAARNDAPNRGEVRVFQFPQDSNVQGPNQIEARIDAEPTISSQVSLWDQSGSKVIKGNLIVIPLQDSLIYLQPIYLQSSNATFPQLQKVVLANSSTVVWGNTLEEALNLLLAGGFGSPGTSPPPSPGPGSSPGPTASPGPGSSLPPDVAGLVAYANQHFDLAQQALRNGDFATYGKEMALVQDALRQLDVLVGPSGAPTLGSPSPAPSPSASPAP